MTNEQINVPSLVVILVLSGLIVRYLFFSAPATPARPPNSPSAQRALEPAVERIQQMFPLVDRRTILWDLQRNGGNMTQTTERILAGQMETPPVTFQPPPPPGNPAGASTAQPGQGQTVPQADKPVHPDLITRYRLKDKILPSSESDADHTAEKVKEKWSSNREERQSLLQKRRDQMILEARRKMEAKLVADKAAAGASKTPDRS